MLLCLVSFLIHGSKMTKLRFKLCDLLEARNVSQMITIIVGVTLPPLIFLETFSLSRIQFLPSRETDQ